MKNIITCRNYKDEIELVTNKKYKYYYHYPVCLDNKLLRSDPVQKIIDNHNLKEYYAFCCDMCKSTHKKSGKSIFSYPHCFYQVLNKETVDYYMSKGYYLLTPGWLKNWEEYVQSNWGFTKEVATSFFTESFKKILVLDTGTSKSLMKDVVAFSDFIGKDFEVLPVGLDHYSKYVNQTINSRDHELELIKKENARIKEQIVNYTMSIELIKNMSSFTNENQILNKIFDILKMMFMPKIVSFIDASNIENTSYEKEDKYLLQIKPFLEDCKSSVFWLDSGKGFASKIFYGEEMLGIIIIDEIYLPVYKEIYYNTYISISNIISLAIYNSRLYEKVLLINKDFQRQKSYFEQLFKNSPEMIIITDHQKIIQNVNKSFKDYFKFKKSLLGTSICDFLEEFSINYKFICNDNTDRVKQVIDITINHKTRHIELSKYGINVNEEIVGYYIILSDVTDRINMRSHLEKMVFKDSLTGLYNRAFCDVEINRLSSEFKTPIGLIIGDVDGLKITNDAFGHNAGDKMLIQTAEILSDSCRPRDLISRWGGDEFVIILPFTEEDKVVEIVKKIKSKCESFLGYEFLSPSISIGYSVLSKKRKTMIQAFVEAEDMMYESKIKNKSSNRLRIVSSLQGSLYEKSFETYEHVQNVSKMCQKVSIHLGFNKQQISEMELFARFHDIGKLLLDNTLLEKKGLLSKMEMKRIQEHSESGFRICKSIAELSPIADFVLHHHERWDGKGYPNRISSYQIPIQARILNVADSIDAMLNDRPYRDKMSKDQVIEELISNKGTQFDPTLVDIFIDLFF